MRRSYKIMIKIRTSKQHVTVKNYKYESDSKTASMCFCLILLCTSCFSFSFFPFLFCRIPLCLTTAWFRHLILLSFASVSAHNDGVKEFSAGRVTVRQSARNCVSTLPQSKRRAINILLIAHRAHTHMHVRDLKIFEWKRKCLKAFYLNEKNRRKKKYCAAHNVIAYRIQIEMRKKISRLIYHACVYSREMNVMQWPWSSEEKQRQQQQKQQQPPPQ